MDAGTRAFRLEIDRTTTPLSGRLEPEGSVGAGVGFVGWTGLAATLERLLAEAAPTGSAINELPVGGEERNR